MTINTNKNGESLVVAIEGRLDTNTAPELEKEINSQLADVTSLVLDLKDLIYMSSAGLRVVLGCQKKINAANGTMVVKNVNDLIMEIFETTGFLDILTVEN